MKILVCGGRNFANFDKVEKALNLIHARTPISHVIHGDARGADRLGRQWALKRGIPQTPFPAAWTDLSHEDADIRTRPDGTQYDAKAGHRRNEQMLKEHPDLVVAFPGNTGTADMRRRAKKAGVPVVRIY